MKVKCICWNDSVAELRLLDLHMNRVHNKMNFISPVGKTNHTMGQARTSEYIRGGIRCLAGVNLPCRALLPDQDQCIKNS
jgi:hypothetical protein